MPLELQDGPGYFDKYPGAHAAGFNCGRNAIAAALLSVKPGKVYIPYYVCEVVRQTLGRYGIPYELYFIDQEFNPAVGELSEGEWLLYVNYFGTQPDSKIRSIVRQYKRVILDNTQAFYADPVLEDQCFNVYSPRKFFGVIDGAYLVWNGFAEVKTNCYPADVSWERGGFLLKSAEFGTNAAYQENLDSMESFSDGIRTMSRLTEKMLGAIDYKRSGEIRRNNYQVLIREFRDINQIGTPMDGYAPLAYPLLIRKEGLRRQLIDRRIYVSQWWKYLLNEVPEGSREAELSEWLLPLPVDQRYTEKDMLEMSSIIKNCIDSISYGECGNETDVES